MKSRDQIPVCCLLPSGAQGKAAGSRPRDPARGGCKAARKDAAERSAPRGGHVPATWMAGLLRQVHGCSQHAIPPVPMTHAQWPFSPSRGSCGVIFSSSKVGVAALGLVLSATGVHNGPALPEK